MTTRIVCISDTRSLEYDLAEQGERTGCADLLESGRRIRPSLDVFGHAEYRPEHPPAVAGPPSQKST